MADHLYETWLEKIESLAESQPVRGVFRGVPKRLNDCFRASGVLRSDAYQFGHTFASRLYDMKPQDVTVDDWLGIIAGELTPMLHESQEDYRPIIQWLAKRYPDVMLIVLYGRGKKRDPEGFAHGFRKGYLLARPRVAKSA